MRSKILILILMFYEIGLVAQQPTQPTQPTSTVVNPANPTPYEPTPGELISEEVDETQLSDEQKRVRSRNLKAEELWKNADYRDYDPSFTELHRLSKAFANNKYRLALSSFQAGINSIIKMRDEIELLRKQSAETRRFNEKWYWQVVDRKTQEERHINRLKREAKQESVTYFTRAVNYLDEIINPDLREKEPFKRLLSAVYRNWVMYQYDLGNIPQIIPILEHYIQIDENEKEYPAHKYLSQAYAFQENMIKKYGMGTEDQMLRFRYKKNVHLLRATELKYGKESAEYKHVVSLVNRDEIISIMP